MKPIQVVRASANMKSEGRMRRKKRDMSAVRSNMADSAHPMGTDPRPRKPRHKWGTGGNPALWCGECQWIKDSKCRVKHDPLAQWIEGGFCRWQAWPLDHGD